MLYWYASLIFLIIICSWGYFLSERGIDSVSTLAYNQNLVPLSITRIGLIRIMIHSILNLYSLIMLEITSKKYDQFL